MGLKDNLIPIARAANKLHGPIEFFHFTSKLWANKTHLSWEDWTAFFKVAEDCGMLYCEKDGESMRPLHGMMVHNLVMTRRRAREAYALKKTAWEFHLGEHERVKFEEEDAKRRFASMAKRGGSYNSYQG